VKTQTMGLESRASEQKENGAEWMVCEDTNHGVRKQSE
jgi:hypothetical protein